jgi:transcription elongation factor GreA-like protein
VIQRAHHDSVHEEIREQVLEMLRKKTYGHFSLEHFRKSQPVENSQTVVVQNAPSQAPTKARVKGRA